jgi:hypothetical protein
MAALDAGVPLRQVQVAARDADPRTTTVYNLRRLEELIDRRDRASTCDGALNGAPQLSAA